MSDAPKPKLLVIAGSWPSAVRYAQQHNLPADAWEYVTKPEQVTRGSFFVLTGLHQYQKHWRDIEDALLRMDCRQKAVLKSSP